MDEQTTERRSEPRAGAHGVPPQSLSEELANEAMWNRMKVLRGRDEARRQGHDEPGDLRFLELQLANVEATLAVYYLLKEKLG